MRRDDEQEKQTSVVRRKQERDPGERVVRVREAA
jgi:hypothetical protein